MTRNANDLPFVGQSERRFDWGDVSSHLDRLLSKRFRSVDASVLEDARQEALLDLLETWVTHASAFDTEAGAYRFEYALNHGMKRAARYIAGEQQRRVVEVPYAFGSGPSTDDEEVDNGAYYDFPDESPGPEELAIEADEQERARQMLAEMSAEELHECFELLEAGSTREIADKLGVDHTTVMRRQAAARKFVRNRASKYGFDVPETAMTNTLGRTAAEQDAYDAQLAAHQEAREEHLAWMKQGSNAPSAPAHAQVGERGGFNDQEDVLRAAAGRRSRR